MWSQYTLFGLDNGRNNGLNFYTMLYWVAMNNNSKTIVTRHIVALSFDDSAA